KSPVTTAVAILSLALGIGANSVIFSLMNALILRPLPIVEPRQVVRVATTTQSDASELSGITLAAFEELSQRQDVFEGMFATSEGGMANFEADGVKYAASLSTVTGEYFETLGVKPALGRFLTRDDVSPAAGKSAPLAVISYVCWRVRYHGDPAVIGKMIRVEGVPLTIVGVTPDSFSGLIIDAAPDATVPIGFTMGDVNTYPFDVCGRLKPGVSIAHAQAELGSVWSAIREQVVPATLSPQRREAFLKKRIVVEGFSTGRSYIRGRFERPLKMLMAIVGLLLLIACANLANLMLARAAGRRGEFGIRVALGAGRWRILRLMLTESLTLTVAGAALGLAAAYAISRPLLATMWTGFVPLALDGSPDWRVIAFTAGVSIVTGLLFGASPAWSVFRSDPALSIRQHSGRGGGVRGSAAGRMLIAGQIALSLVLVIGAVVFVESLGKLRSIDVGFKRDGILLAQLFPATGAQNRKMNDRDAYYRQLAERIESIPGVESVSYSHMGPVTGYEFKSPVAISDAPASAHADAIFELVGPQFFHMIGMRVIAGREFEWRDGETAPPVAIISESLARRLFPDGRAIGQHIDFFERKNLEIVGVVNSASLWIPRSREPLAVYLAYLQMPAYNGPLVDIRIRGDASAVLPAVRESIVSLGRDVVLDAETLNHRADRFLLTERMVAMLGGFFGGLALLLASIGIYGLMSQTVSRRTPEIGLRMALGARPREVVGLILQQVLWMAAAGLAVGIPATLAASRLIAGLVYGVGASDPGVLIASSLFLVFVAALAGFVPALRASRVDPMTALRAE
ncbi:MAG TPA: ABC transporter permease, partial [Bryobacteraceae bacterium]